MTSSRKLAIITGASTGIGRAVALALAAESWDIAFTYLHDEQSAQEVEAAIAACGARALKAHADAGIKADVDAFFADLLRHFDRPPDLLVNNAGTQTWTPLLELEEEDWDRVIRTNLKGCFLNTQRFARLLVAAKKRGSVVNIGSGCNKVPFPNLSHYTASKGGIEMFTKAAAIELGPHGIVVNCIAPGAVQIERTLLESPDYADVWARITPLRRIGLPRDIANAVLFLSTDKAEFITGQTLWVDGGAFTVPNWAYQPTAD
jgi:NAD(P)-dependent dehydrogenase (short-subunit alcohol dehydrogenase family)